MCLQAYPQVQTHNKTTNGKKVKKKLIIANYSANQIIVAVVLK